MNLASEWEWAGTYTAGLMEETGTGVQVGDGGQAMGNGRKGGPYVAGKTKT